MSSRVVSSETAVTTGNTMRTHIDGPLQEALTTLTTQCNTLADPNNWDGPSAVQFRDQVLPELTTSLNNLKTDLVSLQTSIATINTNIQTAGGTTA